MATTLIEYGARVDEARGGVDAAVPPNRIRIPAPPAGAGRPPVTVDGVTIPDASIREEAQHHVSSLASAAYRSAARALVVRQLLLAQAQRLAIAATAARDGKGRRETDDDALIGALLERELVSPNADRVTCRRYYDSHPTKFRSETIYEARHILLAAAVEEVAAREVAKALAISLVEKLTAEPERFAELAREHSACPSKAQGGNLGQLTPGSTVPEFETMLRELQEGQLCPAPVPTRFGFHVVKLDRIVEGSRLPFDMVADRIAAYLEASSWSRAVSQYVGILARRAEIEGIDLTDASGAAVGMPQ